MKVATRDNGDYTKSLSYIPTILLLFIDGSIHPPGDFFQVLLARLKLNCHQMSRAIESI